MVMLYFDKRSRTMSDIKGLPPQYAWSEKIEQISMNGFTVVDNAELPDEWRLEMCPIKSQARNAESSERHTTTSLPIVTRLRIRTKEPWRGGWLR